MLQLNHNSSINRNHKKSNYLASIALFCLLVDLFAFSISEAGTCFERVDSDGKCRNMVSSGVSQEDCCAENLAYSEEDYTEETSSFHMVWNDGISCSSCSALKDGCSSKYCSDGERCLMTAEGPTCICDQLCTDERKNSGPICGSDGQNYANLCKLVRYRCLTSRPMLKEGYPGKCKPSCGDVKCPEGQSCLKLDSGKTFCVECDTNCSKATQLPQPLCAADGRTFHSFCELKAAVCLNGAAIPVKSAKNCSEINWSSENHNNVISLRL